MFILDNDLFIMDHDRGVVSMNHTVLGRRQIDRCEYKAVNWETDNYHTYSESHIRKVLLHSMCFSPFEEVFSSLTCKLS